MRDCLDEPLVTQRLDSSAGGVSGHAEEVNEVLLRRQRIFAGPELVGFDPGPKPRGDLPIWRDGAAWVDLRHIHAAKVTDLQRWHSLTYMGRRLYTLRLLWHCHPGSRPRQTRARLARGLTRKEPDYMPERSSDAAAGQPPCGKITRIALTYTVNTSDGPRHTFHGLIGMQRHVRPERLRELEDDLSVICEDLLINRPQPVTGLPDGLVRIPFGPDPAPAVADDVVPGPVMMCRDLLAAIADALDCPPPASEGDEGVFLRLRSDRARLALAALRPVLADAERGPGQMAEAARRLRDGVAACPADGYAVSSLSS